MSAITLKANISGRTFRVPATDDWTVVSATVADLVRQATQGSARSFEITYKDDDGDAVVLNDASSLAEATRLLGSTLRLHVEVTGVAPTAAAAGDASSSAASSHRERLDASYIPPHMRPERDGAKKAAAKLGRSAATIVRQQESGAIQTVCVGERIMRTWRMRNSADIAWPEGCSLIIVNRGSAVLVAKDEPIIVPALAPNEEGDVRVSLLAPALVGEYECHLRLFHPEHKRFGPRLSVHLRVVDPASSSDDASAAAAAVSSRDSTTAVSMTQHAKGRAGGRGRFGRSHITEGSNVKKLAETDARFAAALRAGEALSLKPFFLSRLRTNGLLPVEEGQEAVEAVLRLCAARIASGKRPRQIIADLLQSHDTDSSSSSSSSSAAAAHPRAVEFVSQAQLDKEVDAALALADEVGENDHAASAAAGDDDDDDEEEVSAEPSTEDESNHRSLPDASASSEDESDGSHRRASKTRAAADAVSSSDVLTALRTERQRMLVQRRALQTRARDLVQRIRTVSAAVVAHTKAGQADKAAGKRRRVAVLRRRLVAARSAFREHKQRVHGFSRAARAVRSVLLPPAALRD